MFWMQAKKFVPVRSPSTLQAARYVGAANSSVRVYVAGGVTLAASYNKYQADAVAAVADPFL